MTIDELIKLLRSNRGGSHRKRVTDIIHSIEMFSLGTEVDTAGMTENELMGGNYKIAYHEEDKNSPRYGLPVLKDEKLVLKK